MSSWHTDSRLDGVLREVVAELVAQGAVAVVLGGKRAVGLLEKALEAKRDEGVLEEIRDAL